MSERIIQKQNEINYIVNPANLLNRIFVPVRVYSKPAFTGSFRKIEDNYLC